MYDKPVVTNCFSLSVRRWFYALLNIVGLVMVTAQGVDAQTTSFTYQGRLSDGNAPANGTYDIQFTLFDSLAGGTQVGLTVTHAAVSVANRTFTVPLDFGSSSFPGADRFLEIGVR